MASPSDTVRDGFWKVDLHTHTNVSPDALSTPAAMVARAQAMGLDRLAITDHNRIDGALAAQALDPARIIVGEEITTAEGTEVLGLYLQEVVPPGLPWREVIRRLRDQGAAIVAPHPTAYPRQRAAHAARAVRDADALEIHNRRAFWPAWNRSARALAAATGRPGVAGSDAHHTWSLGHVWTWLPHFHDGPSLRAALALAQVPEGLPVATVPVGAVLSVISFAWWRATTRHQRDQERP